MLFRRVFDAQLLPQSVDGESIPLPLEPVEAFQGLALLRQRESPSLTKIANLNETCLSQFLKLQVDPEGSLLAFDDIKLKLVVF